jgi:hypothetical protein
MCLAHTWLYKCIARHPKCNTFPKDIVMLMRLLGEASLLQGKYCKVSELMAY